MRMPSYSNVYAKRPSMSQAKRRKNSGHHKTSILPSKHVDFSDDDIPDNSRVTSPPPKNHDAAHQDTRYAIQKEVNEAEDEQIRLTNAYPGAKNTIGSVHQRQWFITLDRVSSGFIRQRTPLDAGGGGGGTEWIQKTRSVTSSSRQDAADHVYSSSRPTGFDPFFVLGPDIERSVVTGRTAGEVMEDEGVNGWVSRKGWRPVLE